MKERNKGVEAYYNNNNEMDCYYSTSELPCKKHPSSSSVGICAYCLKDRLVKLVCSDCGEQRLSSCSCSDEISSHRNSSSCTVEVGSVGRVSFLIENDQNKNNIDQKSETPVLQNLLGSKVKLNHHDNREEEEEQEDEVMVLRRSSSNCVEIKNKGGFWRIGKLFRKNNKKEEYCGRSELWMMDHNNHNHHHHHQHNHGGVSRSRSLCSFRGGVIFGSEDGGSGARSSISAARSSGVNGGLILESGRRSGYSEAAEPRRSGFDGGAIMDVDGGFYGGGVNRRVFSLRESDYFKGMDESSFIDLKLDYSSSETRQEFPSNSASAYAKMGNNNNMADTLSAFGSTRGGSFMAHDGGGGGFYGDGVLNSGGSCRITVNDRGIKRGRKSMKGGWRWIFRYNSSRGGSERKRDEDIMFRT